MKGKGGRVDLGGGGGERKEGETVVGLYCMKEEFKKEQSSKCLSLGYQWKIHIL